MATKSIVGEKVGMTQVWDDQNRAVPVTVVKVSPVRVVQVKTPDQHGYSAVQVTYGTKKAARVNFDWAEIRDVVAKVDEELAEAKEAIGSRDPGAIADEIGDLLFAVVNLARKSGLDAEVALQQATDKFVERFGRVEDELRAHGKKLGDVGLEELDAIWNRIKRENDEARMTNDESMTKGSGTA